MILDAGPLIALDDGNTSRALAYVKRAAERDELHTSHAVLAQVWKEPARQANLSRVLRAVQIHALDNSRDVAAVLVRTGTTDVVDAHLATLGEALGDYVLTTDPGDMTKLGVRYEKFE